MPVHHQAQGVGDVTVHKIENMGNLDNSSYNPPDPICHTPSKIPR